jgi:hypothetical protein
MCQPCLSIQHIRSSRCSDLDCYMQIITLSITTHLFSVFWSGLYELKSAMTAPTNFTFEARLLELFQIPTCIIIGSNLDWWLCTHQSSKFFYPCLAIYSGLFSIVTKVFLLLYLSSCWLPTFCFVLCFLAIYCRACVATIDGYWIDNCIYWITISYTTRLKCITLYNSQQLSLFCSSEDPGSNCCNQLLWHPLPSLVITDSELSDNYLLERLSTSELYSPGTDHKENIVSDSSTVVWRHYRNGPKRKQQFLPLLRCLATVVNKRFHCWQLTYSVHVTIHFNNSIYFELL